MANLSVLSPGKWISDIFGKHFFRRISIICWTNIFLDRILVDFWGIWGVIFEDVWRRSRGFCLGGFREGFQRMLTMIYTTNISESGLGCAACAPCARMPLRLSLWLSLDFHGLNSNKNIQNLQPNNEKTVPCLISLVSTRGILELGKLDWEPVL